MIKNYLKTAWRNLWKNRFYTALNIGGLAVGLATGIMLLLWVQDERSYDRFHKNASNIYQLSSHFNINGEQITWVWVPGPLAVYSKSIPGIESLVRISTDYDQVLADKEKNKVFTGNKVASVDSSFFSIFDFTFLKGNRETAFPDINSIVLTRSTARKVFGTEDAVGKLISYSDKRFTVTAVLEDFPENSSLNYDALLPMGFYARRFTEWGGNGDWKTIDEDLGNFSFDTYVRLQPDADPVKIGKDFDAHYSNARNGDSDAKFQLQNLATVHLVSADGNTSALRTVQIFFLVVILLLTIASINYVNLSTARSLARAREVSIRKIIGAEKRQLFFQFVLETVLLFVIATILAVLFIYLMTPLYNNISGKTLSFTIKDGGFWKITGITVLGTLAAASIYPAFLLSSFKPIESLKGKFKSNLGVASLRKILVVFQFSISVILLVCTIVIGNQMRYIRNKDIGFDRSYVFTVPLDGEAKKHIDAIKAELKKETAVISAATSDAANIANVQNATGDLEWEGKPEDNELIIAQIYADEDFIPTLQMQFAEGSNFTGSAADSAYFVVNETAVQKMGLRKPYIGQQISFHERKGSIRGVVKDFNFKSLKQKISPLLFYHFWDNRNTLYVRTTKANAQKAIRAVERQYKQYAGDRPFSYAFLDKTFETQYKSEQREGSLFNLFAGIAIFISCLGLFGLATYSTQLKVREIGIRKVLGAGVGTILRLITRDFLLLVMISIVVASPIAWWAMNSWLKNFEYRVGVEWWIFILAAIITLLIAVLTISFQSIRAATANPVKSLKTE